MPKPNMYQSLHTSVMTDKGQPFEVQIRTHEMHRIAEEGIAAHWQYKEGKALSDKDAQKIAWLRQILDWQQGPEGSTRLPRDGQGRPLTPRRSTRSRRRAKCCRFRAGPRRSISPTPSTPRSGISAWGPRSTAGSCPCATTLRNGDIVEILTSPGRHPSRDWLSLAKTSRARSKIRAWVNANEREQSLALGRELTEQGASASTSCRSSRSRTAGWPRRSSRWGLPALEDFYAAVGLRQGHAAGAPEPRSCPSSRPAGPARGGGRRAWSSAPSAAGTGGSRSAGWTT